MHIPRISFHGRATGTAVILAALLPLSSGLPALADPSPRPDSPAPCVPSISVADLAPGGRVPGRVLVALSPGPNREVALSRAVARVGAKVERRLVRGKYAVLDIPAHASETGIARALEGQPGVVAASPVYRRRLCLVIPNDPLFSPHQWSMHNTGQQVPFPDAPASGAPDADVDAPEAWAITTGSASVVVAVIDTGIDPAHPDLAPNLWVNPGEIAGDGLDNDGNGYIDDIHGYDFSRDTPDVSDTHGHGTKVAGIIGARGNDGVGVAGLNWDVRLMALKTFNDEGFAEDPELIEAIEYAVANGAHIINASWGGHYASSVLQAAVLEAQRCGVFFVASAGNEGKNYAEHPQYPGAHPMPGLLSVGATDFRDQWARFSNYHDARIDVMAPGSLVFTTQPNGHAFVSGTSFSAPHAAGVAALLLAAEPTLDVAQLRHRLIAGMKPRPALDRRCATGGRLSAHKALLDGQVATAAPAAIADLEVDWIGATGVRVAFTVPETGGPILLYDARISRTPLDESTFGYAERLGGLPSPTAPGTRQSLWATGLDPETVHHIRLRALGTTGRASELSNPVVATTTERTVYFADDMESGPDLWTTTGSFALTTETANSGAWCWTDSPGELFVANQVATLTSPPIDLSTARHPRLRFYHQYLFQRVFTRFSTGGSLQVSTDGSTFETLAIFTHFSNPWHPEQVSLADYAGHPAVWLRFRFHTDPLLRENQRDDGWHIDDVEVYESRDRVPDPPDFVVESNGLFAVNGAPQYQETVAPGNLWRNSASKAVDAALRAPNSRYVVLQETRGSSARFTPILPADGRYEVFAIWGISSNANNVRYTVKHAEGETVVFRNQNAYTNSNRWVSLGTFAFREGRSVARGSVRVDDTTVTGVPIPDSEGRIYADAIRFVHREGVELPDPYTAAWILR